MTAIIAAAIGGAFLLVNAWLTVRLHQMAKAAEKHHAMNGVHGPDSRSATSRIAT